MWVRGLKLLQTSVAMTTLKSHPMWVRGLKLQSPVTGLNGTESHPMWVRGLKLILLSLPVILHVAPYVGAWIETKEPQS